MTDRVKDCEKCGHAYPAKDMIERDVPGGSKTLCTNCAKGATR